MSEVEFNYNGTITIIQCKENEKMSDICDRFATKSETNKDSLFFTYDGKGGNQFKQNLTFSQMANTLDKGRKKMNIIVNNVTDDENNKIIKSKNVLCPKCGESIRLNIKNYKITLFDCKNDHKINNLYLKEFENTQNIDISQIICNNCGENRSNTFKNKFYKCFDCNINLCLLCKENHEEDHNVIEYDKIYYFCKKHNEAYTKYCIKCKLNICMSCEEEHENHDNIYFGKIMPNKKELLTKLDDLKKYLDKFHNDYNEILEILNEVKQNFDDYYEIKKNIINNYR